jgi:hypothetical protein
LNAFFKTYALFRELIRLPRASKLNLADSFINRSNEAYALISWSNESELPIPSITPLPQSLHYVMRYTLNLITMITCLFIHRYYTALDKTIWTLMAFWIAVRQTAQSFYGTNELYLRFLEIVPQFELYNLLRYLTFSVFVGFIVIKRSTNTRKCSHAGI